MVLCWESNKKKKENAQDYTIKNLYKNTHTEIFVKKIEYCEKSRLRNCWEKYFAIEILKQNCKRCKRS